MSARTWREERTASDPEAYVRRLNIAQAGRYEARIVSREGRTATGRIRYVVEFTEVARPGTGPASS